VKIVFLAQWKPGCDRTAIDEFLAIASEALAKGPFKAYEHGVGLRIAQGRARSADWGFVIEIEPGEVERWRASQAHEALGLALRPIFGEGMTIEF
jgi:hypothetical protein